MNFLRQLLVLVLCLSMTMLPACSMRGKSQQMYQQPMAQPTPADVMRMLPYRFALRMDDGRNYIVNAEGATMEQSFGALSNVVNARPNHFQVLMNSNTRMSQVSGVTYDRQIQNFFGQLGYVCNNQREESRQFRAQGKRGMQTTRLYIMDFVPGQAGAMQPMMNNRQMMQPGMQNGMMMAQPGQQMMMQQNGQNVRVIHQQQEESSWMSGIGKTLLGAGIAAGLSYGLYQLFRRD